MDLQEYLKVNPSLFSQDSQSLYDELIAKDIIIEFEINPGRQTWGMQEYPDERRYVIYDPGKGANPAGLIHELLHIAVALKGFRNDKQIVAYFAGKKSFFGSQHAATITPQIINRLAHLKMIRRFLGYGQEPNSFLQQPATNYYDQHFMTELACLQKLRDNGKGNMGRTIFIFVYHIGTAKLFAAYPETAISHNIIEGLKRFDAGLFEEIEPLYDQWQASPEDDNLKFFEGIEQVLKKYQVPHDFSQSLDSIESALCEEAFDLFEKLSEKPPEE